MKVIGTGLSGMVGSRITELLGRTGFEFTNLSLETGVDITDAGLVNRLVSESPAPWIFHFAAKTDVDGCEADRALGENGAAWRINAGATTTLCRAARDTGKHLLYISTDFVFDGTGEFYTETDELRPLSWYGVTKAEGEKAVLTLGGLGLVLRIAYPYGSEGGPKADFVARIRKRLSDGEKTASPEDQIITPTYIDDIAAAIGKLVGDGAAGIYHAVGSEALSPYRASVLIARNFGLDERLVAPVAAAGFYRGRAPRPLHANLKNAKIISCGIKMRTFSRGLTALAGKSL